jgi:hypothetical protein
MSPIVREHHETLRKAVECLCIGDTPFDYRITKSWQFLGRFHSDRTSYVLYPEIVQLIDVCSKHFNGDYSLVEKPFSDSGQRFVVNKLLDAFSVAASVDDAMREPPAKQ